MGYRAGHILYKNCLWLLKCNHHCLFVLVVYSFFFFILQLCWNESHIFFLAQLYWIHMVHLIFLFFLLVLLKFVMVVSLYISVSSNPVLGLLLLLCTIRMPLFSYILFIYWLRLYRELLHGTCRKFTAHLLIPKKDAGIYWLMNQRDCNHCHLYVWVLLLTDYVRFKCYCFLLLFVEILCIVVCTIFVI